MYPQSSVICRSIRPPEQNRLDRRHTSSVESDRERSLLVADNRQPDHERVGTIAGLGAGVIAGAQIGTIFIPIPIVGTFTGALIGGVLGSEIGRNVGAALLDGVTAFTDSLSGHGDDSDGAAPPPGQSAS
jgi:outer membrane lipoprotein SlyB